MYKATVWLTWDISTDCENENECREKLEKWLHKYNLKYNNKKDLPESFCVFTFDYKYKQQCFDELEKKLRNVFRGCKCKRKFFAVCYMKYEQLTEDGILII